jgi:hypothetical protein
VRSVAVIWAHGLLSACSDRAASSTTLAPHVSVVRGLM